MRIKRENTLPIPYSFVHQFCSDSTVHSSANGTDNPTLGTTNLSNTGDFLPDELFLGISYGQKAVNERGIDTDHSPVLFATANVDNKATNDFLAPRRMCDFWVKLDAIERFCVVCNSCVWCRVCTSDDMEIGRHLGQLVSVRHPYLYPSL